MKQKWTQMMILGGLTAVVVMGTGCKKETPDSILKEAVKKQAEAKSVDGSMEMDMTMGMAQSGVSMEMDMNPVSYTHLDVYKRQAKIYCRRN